MLDLVGGEAQLLSEAERERALAGPRRPVEEDVALAAARGDHALEDLAVLRREVAEELPREGGARIELPVEAAGNRLVRSAVHEAAERVAVEVVVAVEKAELQQSPLRRHRLGDLGVGTVQRHRVVEGLVAVLHAARPAEARLVVHVREREDFGLEVVELQDPLQLGEAVLHDVRALPRVGEHVLAHRLQHLAALVARVLVVPEDLQHVV